MIALRLTLIALVFAVTFAAPLPSYFSVDYPVSNVRTPIYDPSWHVTAMEQHKTAAQYNDDAIKELKLADQALIQQNDKGGVKRVRQMIKDHASRQEHHIAEEQKHDRLRMLMQTQSLTPEQFGGVETDTEESIEKAKASIKEANDIVDQHNANVPA